MAFKLIALDLDDTLLRSDLTISSRTRNAVKKAVSAGVRIAFATGRVPSALSNYVKMLGLNKNEGCLVCGNGTMIISSVTGELIDEVYLPVKDALAAFDLIDAEDFSAQIYDGSNIIVSRRNEFSNTDEKLTGMKQVIPENFRSFLAEKRTHKIVVPADPMLLKPLERILRNVMGDKLTLFTSKPYYLELLPPDCNKGTALEKIAAKFEIAREEVMAFGDSMNDEAMIRWAGCGIAMCNGDSRIKDAARMITEKSNDEDGVAIIIERHILSGLPLPSK
ncbi:MAG: Cof-type HAD-IIB family hydrolase [Spirochaetaceae bacterium]|jgi:Cof subfamily protein (haloacid dehalogenase superfamily)|nr:Cof-type HAD-IIB family hydrolase [Spirochaetaceae bacterium]